MRVAGTKRGAHLALSLERLDEPARAPDARRSGSRPRCARSTRCPTFLGLSATQRPVDIVQPPFAQGHRSSVEVIGPRSGRARRAAVDAGYVRPTRSSGPPRATGRRTCRRSGPHVERAAPADAGRCAPRRRSSSIQLPAPRRAGCAHRLNDLRERTTARRSVSPRTSNERLPRCRVPGARPSAQSGAPAGADGDGAREGPPRLVVARAAPAHRGRAQVRPAALRWWPPRQPRAGHRHGRGRSRDPGRVAAERGVAGCSASAAPVTRSGRCPARA